MKQNCLTIFLLLLGGFLYAQEVTVKGTVQDAESGEPLIGVNVLMLGGGDSGGAKGTITDFNGDFELQNVPVGTVLQFS